MDPKYEKRLEKRYKAYVARKGDLLRASVFLIVINFFLLAAVSSEYIPSPYGIFFFYFGFLATIVSIRYFLREPVEIEIFAELYKAHERIGFYFEDNARSQLANAQSHLFNVENKLGKLLSGKKRSLLYKGEADEPLKELRDGIKKRILPSISRRKNLKQIREKVGRLAIIFIESPPKFNKIREYNKGLKAIREIPKKNLGVLILNVWRSWLKEPTLAFIFSILLVTGITVIIHPTGFAYVREKIAEIITASAVFAGIILAGKRAAIEKRVPVKER